MKILYLILPLSLSIPLAPSQAQRPSASHVDSVQFESRWVTLGTRGGPMASGTRSQPANLLLQSGHAYLIDAGDGTVGQLAKLAIRSDQIDAVFISHLHFDHTAGLAGLLGLRWQTNAPTTLRIYGPPGTKALVDGTVASMLPGTTAGYGVPGAPPRSPRDQVEVVELRDGANLAFDGMQVLARKNTHYSFVPGSEFDQEFESLAFRFNLSDRSIVFTGDTGPSAVVEELAEGADLLVAEMMDVDDTIANVRRSSPDLAPRAASEMEQHLKTHHLLPENVGTLAHRAGVGAVVVTHFVGMETGQPEHMGYLREIAEHYAGPVVIANDLEVF